MKKIAFKTLGCRLNQFETDALVTCFTNAGYQIATKGETADAVIINTCTVTNMSDKKSKYEINRAVAKNPGAIIVAAGCMVNNHRDTLEKKTGITYVVDNQKKSSIFSIVDNHFRGEIVQPENYPNEVFGFEAVEKSLHTRTFIKIQDGCDHFCTYCIVPSVRGRAVSRKPSEIIENVKRVTENGFREIVITGVNIGRYQYESINFESILEMILELNGDFRVRISSIEPDGFTDGFPQLFRHPKLTPHLHLCLQSGSDSILLKMHRMYTVRKFKGILQSFRNIYSDFNFSTDVITGFPGETEDDFRETCRIAEDSHFSHIHTFRYSRRKGTRADLMDDQIPEKIKAERSEMIRKISEKSRRNYFLSLVGKTQKVLVEKTDRDGFAYGYGENYVPVVFYSPHAEINRFYEVSLEHLREDGKDGITGRELTN